MRARHWLDWFRPNGTIGVRRPVHATGIVGLLPYIFARWKYGVIFARIWRTNHSGPRPLGDYFWVLPSRLPCNFIYLERGPDQHD